MAFLKRDHIALLMGIGVLALGLGLLVFTFSHALAIASAPGDFFRSQFPQNQTPAGPTASFRWDMTDFNATVQDTSNQGDSAINSWQWDFGDGTRMGGATPGPHRYSNASVYEVSLILRDANGKESRALAQVQVVPTQIRSGESVGDPTAGLTGGNRFSDRLHHGRVHAGHNREDPQDPVVLRIDADAEDHVRVGPHGGRQALDDLVGRAEPQARPGADVDQGAIRPAVVDLEERIVQRIGDDPAGIVLRVLSVEHGRRPAGLEDRADVAEVQIDQRGDRDRFGDPLDDLADQVVHHREGLLDGEVRDEVQEAVVVEEDQRVRRRPEWLDAGAGVPHATAFAAGR